MDPRDMLCWFLQSTSSRDLGIVSCDGDSMPRGDRDSAPMVATILCAGIRISICDTDSMCTDLVTMTNHMVNVCLF